MKPIASVFRTAKFPLPDLINKIEFSWLSLNSRNIGALRSPLAQKSLIGQFKIIVFIESKKFYMNSRLLNNH